MAKTTSVRKIGLSLAADICWPMCYEMIMKRLDLSLQVGAEKMRFEVDRLSIEPFRLQQDSRYDVVIDRLTHWYVASREWIKKAIILNDLYVFNNPWSIQSMEKQTSYCAMMRLGFPIPETWLLPPKSYADSPDLQRTLEQYARHFDFGHIGESIGYPFYMKPYDGGAWAGVSRVDSDESFQKAYDESGMRIMNIQKSVEPFEKFVRCIGLGPQIRFVRYDPAAPLHDRYTLDTDFLSDHDKAHLKNMTMTINSFFGWDFNSCEALLKDGVWHPIDFANPCPDSQVTSLHYHFPWLIKANIRWSVYCAATKRKLRPNLDFSSYYKIAGKSLSFEEKLEQYGELASKRFTEERFFAFCRKHLPHLDEVASEFFSSSDCRDAIHQKVRSMYPDHEIEEFTELFWERIQKCLTDEEA